MNSKQMSLTELERSNTIKAAETHTQNCVQSNNSYQYTISRQAQAKAKVNYQKLKIRMEEQETEI